MEDKMNILYDRLKEKGIRLTPQRKVILDLLKGAEEHLTAEEIYQNIKQQMQPVSLGTVYNTLHKLKEAGVIQELTYGDMSSRYDGNSNLHYHVTCVDCGKVMDYKRDLLKSLEAEAGKETGFVISSHRMEFYGVCPDCQSKGEVAASS
ncbi:MAG: Fur family transcriptional regulator [Bacillota bacterium]|nr:Fur family transcriptional regulator [Bacillota bacterium]